MFRTTTAMPAPIGTLLPTAFLTDSRGSEWIDQGPNASAEERATLCRLRLYVSEENACTFFDPSSDSACDHVTVPAVHLAEGFATDWWSIFGGRDREHPIRNYRTGFALPDVSLGFDGSTFEVRGRQFACENPDVRFWQVRSAGVPREVAESTLSQFIEGVAARLATAGVQNSAVALRWSRVSRSLDNPDERAFCEAAGALGVDPYGVSETDALFIEESARLFEGETLLEFLAGVGNTARGELLNWVREVEARPREQACLPELNGIVDRIAEAASGKPTERGWATGYRAARVFRNAVHIPRGERFGSLSDVTGRLGSASFACAPGVPGISALVCRGDDIRIHVRQRGPWEWARHAESFAFARAVGDVICFGDTRRSVVNSLHRAERQAAGRAFAAEFLAPVESVLDMVDSGLDDEEIAGSFSVSPQVIAWQIENRERIREACAERGPRVVALTTESVEEDSFEVFCPEVSEEILEEE